MHWHLIRLYIYYTNSTLVDEGKSQKSSALWGSDFQLGPSKLLLLLTRDPDPRPPAASLPLALTVEAIQSQEEFLGQLPNRQQHNRYLHLQA